MAWRNRGSGIAPPGLRAPLLHRLRALAVAQLAPPSARPRPLRAPSRSRPRTPQPHAPRRDWKSCRRMRIGSRRWRLDAELTRLGLRKSHLELAMGDPAVAANFVEMRRVTSELADVDRALAPPRMRGCSWRSGRRDGSTGPDRRHRSDRLWQVHRCALAGRAARGRGHRRGPGRARRARRGHARSRGRLRAVRRGPARRRRRARPCRPRAHRLRGRGALRDLEAIVHPAVRPRILAELEAAAAAGAAAVVIEAIKLVEGGLAELCDEVWLVTCDPDVAARAAGRAGERAATTPAGGSRPRATWRRGCGPPRPMSSTRAAARTDDAGPSAGTAATRPWPSGLNRAAVRATEGSPDGREARRVSGAEMDARRGRDALRRGTG